MKTVLRNARLVLEDRIAHGLDLVMEGSYIHSLVPAGSEVPGSVDHDCQDGYVMPGFIDIHADYIEHIAAPRPSALMDFNLALKESERELIGHGITTMYHSLSLYKNSEFGNKPIRNPENVRRLVDLIHQGKDDRGLVRHRFHARFEIDNLDQIDALEEMINKRQVHLLSFMDHSPGQGQYRNMEMFKETLKGYRNLGEAELDAIIGHHQSKEKMALDHIGELTALARAQGIAVASHDDDTLEKVRLVRSWGTGISEFPITLEVALAARELGMHTVAGAPNVMLGGSHSGNLGAADAIVAGAVDVLCSDYYPAAMIHAVFRLHREYGLDLAEMVRLVTLNPARAVGLDWELGSLVAGKKADLLVVDTLEDGFPAVTAAWMDGGLAFQTHYRKSPIPQQGRMA